MRAEVCPLKCNHCGTEWDEPLEGKNPRVPVHCPNPGCRKNKKIPVRAFAGAGSRAAHPSPARVNSRRASAEAVVRRPQPAPRRAQPQYQGAVEADGPTSGDMIVLAAQLLGRLVGGKPGAMAGGAVAELAVWAGERRGDDGAIEGVVIPPGQVVDGEPAGLPTLDLAELGRGAQPARGPWCGLCEFLGNRTKSGRWPQATYRVDLTGDPYHLLLCGNCLRRMDAQGAVVQAWPLDRSAAARPGEFRRAVTGEPAEFRCHKCGARAVPPAPPVCPCGRADWRVSRVSGASGRASSRPRELPAAVSSSPNQTLVLSGVY